MKDIFETNFSRNLAGLCLIVAPTLYVMSDITLSISKDFYYLSYVFGKAGTAMFVFAIFVLVQMLKPKMEKLALIAGGMAIIGAITGATLGSFIYFGNELKNSGLDAATIQSIRPLFNQVYMTMVFMPLPGLFFPIGLLALSIGLFIKKVVPRPIAIVLALAAITFPMGRISGNQIIFIVTNILFLISLVSIGWQIFGSQLALNQKLKYSEV